MKKLLIAVLIIATGAGAYSFYADTQKANAYDQVKDKGMVAFERKVKAEVAEIEQKKQSKAALALESWKKLSREEKLKLVEEKHAESVKKSAEKWTKKPTDKKIEAYEKRLTRNAMSKEEKAKIAKAKLADKCKNFDKEDEAN